MRYATDVKFKRQAEGALMDREAMPQELRSSEGQKVSARSTQDISGFLSHVSRSTKKMAGLMSSEALMFSRPISVRDTQFACSSSVPTRIPCCSVFLYEVTGVLNFSRGLKI
ncbi:hypothetical protein TNCV_2036541 [Trichonephila clavipes]|nr:hypothetical protein TNCV_2036541 [Trichonephila clavipes]